MHQMRSTNASLVDWRASWTKNTAHTRTTTRRAERTGLAVCVSRVWRVADRARETSERDEQWGRDERAAGAWAWLWSSGLVIRFRNVCACGYATSVLRIAVSTQTEAIADRMAASLVYSKKVLCIKPKSLALAKVRQLRLQHCQCLALLRADAGFHDWPAWLCSLRRVCSALEHQPHVRLASRESAETSRATARKVPIRVQLCLTYFTHSKYHLTTVA